MANTLPGACLSFSFMRLIFSWAVLYSGSSNPQLIMLKIPSTNIHWVFSMLCTWLYQITCSMLKETKFSRLISLWQKVSGISLKYPHFFLFFWKRYFKWPLGGSNVLEQTFVNDGWFHSHLPFCTPLLKLHVLTVGRSWQWCIKVYFISISSHSSKLRFDRHLFLSA